jgi:hypothetical protein
MKHIAFNISVIFATTTESHFCADLCVNVLFEHREPSKHHGSVSSLTTFISQNIIQTDSTSVRHRHINVEGKDH